jgi:hypothetical protein
MAGVKVALDLDWTLADFTKIYHRLLGTSRALTIGELKALIHASGGITRKIVFGVWTDYYGVGGIYPELTDPTWPAVVNSLKRGGIAEEVKIVSSRSEEERKNIEDWLERVGLLEFLDDVVLLGVDGKKEREDIDVLVDDILDNCLDMQVRGKKAILWCKGVLNDSVRFPQLKTAKSALEVLSLLTFYGGK